jgi:hypothetical protein
MASDGNKVLGPEAEVFEGSGERGVTSIGETQGRERWESRRTEPRVTLPRIGYRRKQAPR